MYVISSADVIEVISPTRKNSCGSGEKKNTGITPVFIFLMFAKISHQFLLEGEKDKVVYLFAFIIFNFFKLIIRDVKLVKLLCHDLCAFFTEITTVKGILISINSCLFAKNNIS